MVESKKWDVDLSTKFKLGAALVLCIAFTACGSDDDRTVSTDIIDFPATLGGDEDVKSKAQIKFEQTEIITGKITQGEVLNFEYHFENVGDGPLVISSVIGSCGCTIPKNYPKGKIMPGEKGTIEVEFNSDNKWGEQIVTISVATNTLPSLTQLLIRTEIVAPDNTKTNN